jgi:RNA-directed DNA polymerase
MLEVVFEHVEKAWRRWLSRRSRESFISWDVFDRLRKVFPLPKPRIYHAI